MTYRSGLLSFVLLSAGCTNQDAGWSKFVARDGTYSFHYPAGWKVAEQASSVAVSKAATEEEILVAALAFDRSKGPAEHAEQLFAPMRAQAPNLRVTPGTAGETNASFDLAYSSEGKAYSGFAVVVKGDNQAIWLSHSAPSQGYDRAGAASLLQTVLSTLAKGADSRPPAAPNRPRAAAVAPPVAGNWSTLRNFGDVVDAATGAYRRGSYSAELFELREDGSFRHVTIGSGQVISGMSTQEGDYSVSGNLLVMHAKTESWQPDPSHPGQKAAYRNNPLDATQRFTIRFEGAQTLILVELPYKTETLLYRQASSKQPPQR